MSDMPSASTVGGAVERGRSRLKTRLRNRVTAGLILVVPIWITLMLIGFVFRLMRDASFWIIEALLTSPWTSAVLERLGMSAEALRAGGIETLPLVARWILALFCVFLTVGVIYVLGMVTTNIVGRRVVLFLETLVGRVPLVKTIYRASKQVLESFAGESAQSFQRVVLVPFPTHEVRTVGFITRITRDPVTGDQICAVFVATAPNPTTGFVFVTKRRELIELDWTVEDAMKVVMSGGVLLPDVIVSQRDTSSRLPGDTTPPTTGRP